MFDLRENIYMRTQGDLIGIAKYTDFFCKLFSKNFETPILRERAADMERGSTKRRGYAPAYEEV